MGWPMVTIRRVNRCSPIGFLAQYNTPLPLPSSSTSRSRKNRRRGAAPSSFPSLSRVLAAASATPAATHCQGNPASPAAAPVKPKALASILTARAPKAAPFRPCAKMLVAAPAPAPETNCIQNFAPTREEKPSDDKKKEEQVLQQQTDEDMISKLVDDILILILENVNLTTSVRAGILSTRWRHLPWLLRQLSIDIKDFFREPYDHDHPTVDHIDTAMASLTEAVRSMLAPTRRKSIITRLCVSFFVTSGYSNEVGRLVSEAIENGMVKDIELTCGINMLPTTLSEEDMENHSAGVISFFGNYPNVYCCLTRLSLYDARFAGLDLNDLVANKLTQLHYLYLHYCDTGFYTSFKVDAPESKLSVLEFCECSFDRVELFCLPKLKQLICGVWLCPSLPVTLGYVPCLKEVEFYGAITSHSEPFKLSEFLCGTSFIDCLTLDFMGRKIWIQPEKDQLRSGFSNLTLLHLHGVFVGFGLMWTMMFLEVAPSLQTLRVELFDHRRCRDENDEELRTLIYGERTNGPWEVSKASPPPPHSSLKELEFFGFNATEEHMAFIGAVMERASNLRSVVLKEQYCEECDAVSIPNFVECGFPKNKDVQDKIRNQFTSSAQIFFYEHSPCSV